MIEPGYDLLGAAHPLFPVDKLLREIPKTAPIGFFWNAFGDSKPCFKKWIAHGNRIFRPQMWWSDAHATVPMNVLEVVLEELKAFLARYGKPDMVVYVSPSCEHEEKKISAMKQRLELVERIVPNCIPVNNPIKGKGVLVPGYLTELHGGSPGWCDLTSTDGTNIYDIDAASWVKKYGNKEHPAFMHGYRFNLREIPDPGQKPPAIKNRKAAPDVRYFRSIKRLAYPVGDAPRPIFSSTNFTKPSIYKTHAEDDQELSESTPDELRENRPVLIIKPNAPTVDILTHTGAVIGKLSRYKKGGDFTGGLTRYYSGLPGGIGLYGYEIGDKAKKLSGHEFVWFRAGRTILGPVHPAFRAGVYR